MGLAVLYTKLTLAPIFTINTTADTVYNNLAGSEPVSFLQVKGTLMLKSTLYIIIVYLQFKELI